MTRTGWYSATAAKQHGWRVYKDPKGNEVKVTFVTTTDGSEYVWTDKVCVGPIVGRGKTLGSDCGENGVKRCVEMEGVDEYIDGSQVELTRNNLGHLVIEASNEGGYNCTQVNILQLIQWLKTNRPEILQ
jgi:hypothetical protein